MISQPRSRAVVDDLLRWREALGEVDAVHVLEYLAKPGVERLVRSRKRAHRGPDVIGFEHDDGHVAAVSAL